jgi:hypothetical protein
MAPQAARVLARQADDAEQEPEAGGGEGGGETAAPEAGGGEAAAPEAGGGEKEEEGGEG